MQPNTKQWIIRFNEQILFFLIILAGKDQEMVQMCYKYLTAYQMWRLRRKKGQKKISGLQDNAIKLPPAYKLIKNKLISKHANSLDKPPRSKCQGKPLGWEPCSTGLEVRTPGSETPRMSWGSACKMIRGNCDMTEMLYILIRVVVT